MKNSISIIIITFCLPFIIWGVSGIGPTFDDYTSLQSTWYIQISDPGYFFSDCIRRPWDFLFGCILGYFPSLFPTLNHIFIILGHTGSTLLVYAICRRLKMNTLASNIAALFFFFSPATLGATLACDGLNQTYAQLWGLISLCFFLKKQRALWILCLIMATFSKENGLAWAIVGPIISYSFALSNKREALKHAFIGIGFVCTYLILMSIITLSGIFGIVYDEQYAEQTIVDHLKDFIQWMIYTWVPIDFMSIVYKPTRNWLIAGITMLMVLPFLILLGRQWRKIKHRQLLSLIACFFILIAPHLITLVSIMHNYASLSMAALIIAYIINQTEHNRLIIPTFTLFLLSAVFTDIHHYLAARQSGELSKQMASFVINNQNRTDHKIPKKVLCINIDDEQLPRYSNFCVRPVDAFAWGLSVCHYSHYEWKTQISSEIIPIYDRQQIKSLADSALHSGSEEVWIVGHDGYNIKIVKP